jgi:RNA polymerase sigma factor (sigma-70 family)
MSSESPPDQASTSAVDNCTFKSLFERSRLGDQEACRLLFQRYQHHVVRIIRRRLLRPKNPLRLLVDSEDLGQLAWTRVFDSIVRGHIAFASERDFLNFLLTVTENTFRKEYRFYISTSKRSLSRQESLTATNTEEMASRSDDPAQAAAASDEYWQFLDELPDEKRSVIRASLEAGGMSELARCLGQDEHAVQSLIVALQWKWDRSRAEKPKR